ncbi:MAG: ComF family protein [Ignavibacteriales bacterium]|nr:ComF family protein [Ignavibacteriales bacterium]
MKKFVNNLLDFFLPRICIHCKSKLNNKENILCSDCFEDLLRVDEKELANAYNHKFSSDKIISDFTSLYFFEVEKPVQAILHEYKYHQKIGLGKYIGDLIASHLGKTLKKWQVDYIVPIPLHFLKKANRGFNQSLYISKELSKNLLIPFENKLIKRMRFTETQTKLGFTDRQLNVKNAFNINHPERVFGKNILLVDDVITTGATISECAREFKKYNAKNIYAVSFAMVKDK